MKHPLIFIVSLIFTVHLSSAQSASQFKKQLKKSVKEIKDSKGKKSVSSYKFKEFFTAIPDDILKELPKYESDTLHNVKRLIFDLYDQTGKKNDLIIKQAVVQKLVSACKDNDFQIRKYVSNKLKYYPKEAFTDISKTKLSNYLKDDQSIFKNIIRIVAYLDMDDQISQLNNLLSDTSLTDQLIRWDLSIALARLGDEEQILYCVEYARSIGVNDRIIHYLLKDLVYTKQKECFDYLLEILFSDAKNCIPPNPDLYDPIVCGYRIMEIISTSVIDYPYETYPGTSQLKADDYDEALETVRQWFRDNPDYQISRNNF
jgi:hypothetical protein